MFPGDRLEQRHFASSHTEMHEHLVSLWRPRWQSMENLTEEEMTRISNFIQAYMPKATIALPSLTSTVWKRSAHRFKATAARGPDGYAKEDLTNMAPGFTDQLVHFFTKIEEGSINWPEQMLEGHIQPLAKVATAMLPSEYRPITIFSINYRCWASLRARQTLRQLAPSIHPDAHGFLPGREAAQSWLQIQACAELALSGEEQLHGLATDLKRAFNNIRRAPIFQVAEHIGFPLTLLGPWRLFLSSFRRRFRIGTALSEPVASNCGFTEGDPLSVVAMVLLDWMLHVFQVALHPGVRFFSFVDNLSLVSKMAEPLVMAFFGLTSFLQLLGLSIDPDKSYSWGTTSNARQAVAPLGFPTVKVARELGGTLNFGLSPRVLDFFTRSRDLGPKWLRLKRSPAPLAQKLVALPMAFWSCALHGAEGSLFADSHVQALRIKAVKELGLQRAGLNPALRLSLASPPTADPGYYQLKQVVQNFRRILYKCPDLQVQWKMFMNHFDGRLLSGPFSKILALFGTIGWEMLEPPWFRDHDGLHCNLLQLDQGTLDMLLYEAWLQWLAKQVSHRKSMKDLRGLDPYLTRLDHHRLVPKDFARVMALQSGSFITTPQQAKFDKTKDPLCSVCAVPDTLEHWFTCDALAELRTDDPSIFSLPVRLPDCAIHHLLVPRSPWTQRIKHHFHNLPIQEDCFLSSPSEGVQHIFTDGSCFTGATPMLSSAAWAAINASTGAPIVAGHQRGMRQSIGRAEITAVLAALKWANYFEAAIFMWSDSRYVVNRVQDLLRGTVVEILPNWENHDLWEQIYEDIQQGGAKSIEIAWIPSHLDYNKCDTPFEEWISLWNAQADQLATEMNRQRSEHFVYLQRQEQQYFDEWATNIRQTRDYLLAVAEQKNKVKNEHPEFLIVPFPEDWAEELGDDTLAQHLPVNWLLQLRGAEIAFPTMFYESLFRTLHDMEDTSGDWTVISIIELTLWMAKESRIHFPFWNSQSRDWDLQDITTRFVRPTLASLIGQVRKAVEELFTIFQINHFYRRGLICPAAAITTDGLSLRIPRELHARMLQLVSSFSGGRLIRKTADLAKPIQIA